MRSGHLYTAHVQIQSYIIEIPVRLGRPSNRTVEQRTVFLGQVMLSLSVERVSSWINSDDMCRPIL